MSIGRDVQLDDLRQADRLLADQPAHGNRDVGHRRSSPARRPANLEMSSMTLAMSGTVGVTPNVEVAVVVPLIDREGLRHLDVRQCERRRRPARSSRTTSSPGSATWRRWPSSGCVKFKGPDVPDPGGIAINVVTRLPTGSFDNLRGLGVTRTLASRRRLVRQGPVSSRTGRSVSSSGTRRWPPRTDEMRHQFQYAVGVEIVAAPKITFLVDLLGQRILGAGPIGLGSVPVLPGSGATSAESLVVSRRQHQQDHLDPRHEGKPHRETGAVAERARHDAEQRPALESHPGRWPQPDNVDMRKLLLATPLVLVVVALACDSKPPVGPGVVKITETTTSIPTYHDDDDSQSDRLAVRVHAADTPRCCRT